MVTERVFVARERELEQLQQFLDRALASQGQVCFVTGEAGSGKTALLTEFARRSQEAHDDLLVTIGNCNSQTGIGDPNLPFREVLGLLTGDVEARLAQGAITQENARRLQDFLPISGRALVDLGPDLIDTFVSASRLAERARALPAGTGAIEIFFSYAHEDEELRDELDKHLSFLKRQGVTVSWHDRQIVPGMEWDGEIDMHLNTAHMILLLVSPDFLASHYCMDVEAKRAMERHEAGEATVIPIILRQVDWMGAPFGKLQCLPTNALPVTSWANRDEAFTDVAQGIAKAVAELAASGTKAGWLYRLEKLAKRKVPGPGGLQQSQVFQQYTNVLREMAAKQPLVLLLDNLQWADVASIELLFHLGWRIGGNRILIVGAYRPEEVALGRLSSISGQVDRHPLEKVINEFKRRSGSLPINLDGTDEAEGRRFVDVFLDTEHNRLGEGFRQALFQLTEGQPLFTIELLRDMQERGDIIQDEHGYWVEGGELVWDALPVRVEGVIEERIGRLKEELHEILSVASVEGEDFTAQVIARVQEIQERQLLRELSRQLEKRHRLVRERGGMQVGRQMLSRYQFVHNLFQQYLYDELGAGERRLLHREIAAVLEGLYEGRTEEITVQLARHYTEAQEPDKATYYLSRAGEQAAALFANTEAVSYFTRALDLTTEEDLLERSALHFGLGKALMTLGEFDDALDHLTKAYDLFGDISEEIAVLGRARVCFCIGRSYEQMGGGKNLKAALEWQDRGLVLLPERPTAEAAMLHASGGLVKLRQGDFDQAAEKGELSLALAEAADAESEQALAHRLLSVAFRAQGHLDLAMRHACSNIRICKNLSDLIGLAKGYSNLGVLAFEKDRWKLAEKFYLRALATVRRVGDEFELARVYLNLGDLYFHLGEIGEGLSNAERSLEMFTDVNSIQGGIVARVLQAALFWRQGNLEEAEGKLLEAQELAEEEEVVMFKPTVGRWLAQIYVTAGDANRAEAELQDLLRLDTGILADDAEPIQRLRGQVLAEQGKAEETVQVLKESLARLNQQGARYQAGLTRLALANVLAEIEGRAQEARGHIERARAIFVELGAKLDEQEAEELLTKL